MSAPTTRRSRHADQGRTRTRRVVLAPTRRQWLDLGLLTALCLLALVGLRSTYGGIEFFLVGAVGVLLGVALGHLGTALRQPLFAVVLAALVTFFLLGGVVALRRQAIGGVLPGPGTVRGLGEVTVHGWKDLLTTLPPVGNTGSLLVIPYLLGLLAGVLGASLAERTRGTFTPLLAPVALLVVVILLGTARPVSLVLQGGGFAILALGWVALRARQRRDTLRSGAGRRTRVITAAALLAVAASAAVVVGPALPGNGSYRRLVLRDYIVPPFDISRYPSPLAGMRRYTTNGALNTTVLLTETGLPTGTPIRIATMDSYDGSVWAASNDPSTDGETGTFQRVGETVAAPVAGVRSTVHVTLGPGYSDVWVPTAGELAKASLPGGESALASFRYNVATGTAVLPGGLTPGESYTLSVVVPPQPTDHPTALGTPLVGDDLTSFTSSAVSSWTDTSAEAWTQLQAVAAHLHSVGKYSDGGGAQATFLPGHSLGRLTAFLSATQLVGNDEQYAAIFALMANEIGFPARVVLGAVPEPGGIVKGSDVHAWVEIRLASGRWLAIPTAAFTPDRSQTPDNAPPQSQQNAKGKIVPPPNSVNPPSSLDNPDPPQSNAARRSAQAKKNQLLGVPVPGFLRAIVVWGGPPLLLIALLCLAVVATKAVRRRRRRSRGSAVLRLAAGWREVLDHARDLGADVTASDTRPEQAGHLPAVEAVPLARAADAGVFGPGEPAQAMVADFWHQVVVTRRQMSHSVGRWRRVRAAVSLRSLRRPRPARSG